MRGHHVYQSVWTSTIGENLFTASDKREALSYDEFAIGVYKDEKCSLLVGHLPINISSLSYHFLKKSSENKIIVKITGKKEKEIGLVHCTKSEEIPDGKLHFLRSGSPSQLCLYHYR